MDDDDLDIYGDLIEFQQVEEKKSKELAAWEEKYNQALKDNDALRQENKEMAKKIKTIEVNFQNLLDTAKAEVKRQEKLIAQLRKEKDDICFRRKRAKLDESHQNAYNQKHEIYETKPIAAESETSTHTAAAKVKPVEEPHKSSNAVGGESNRFKDSTSSSTPVANGIKPRHEKDSHRRHERDPRTRPSRHDDDADRNRHHNNDKRDKPNDFRRDENERRRRDNSRDRRDRYAKDERKDGRSRTEQQSQKRSADKHERRDRQSADKRGSERSNSDNDDTSRKERHSKRMEDAKKPKDVSKSVESKDLQLADAPKVKIEDDNSFNKRTSKAIEKTTSEDSPFTAVTNSISNGKSKTPTEPPGIDVNSNTIKNQTAEISLSTPKKMALYNELFGKPLNANEKKANPDKDLLKNVLNVTQYNLNGSKHTKTENEVEENVQVAVSTSVPQAKEKEEIHTIEIADNGKNEMECIIPGLDLVNTNQSVAEARENVSNTFNSQEDIAKNKDDSPKVATIEEAKNEKEILSPEGISNKVASKDETVINRKAAIKSVTAGECNLNLLTKAVDILEADAIKEANAAMEIAKTDKMVNDGQPTVDTGECLTIMEASEEAAASERVLESTEKVADEGEGANKSEVSSKADTAMEGKVESREKIDSEKASNEENDARNKVASNEEDQSEVDARKPGTSKEAVKLGKEIVSTAAVEEAVSSEDVAPEENITQQTDKNTAINAAEDETKTQVTETDRSKEVAIIKKDTEEKVETVSEATDNDLAQTTTELSKEKSIREPEALIEAEESKNLKKASPKYSDETQPATAVSSTLLMKNDNEIADSSLLKASTPKETLKENTEQSRGSNDAVRNDIQVVAEKAQIEIIKDVRLPQKFTLNKITSNAESVVKENANDVPAGPSADNENHDEHFALTDDKEKSKAQNNKMNSSELESIPDISSDAIELALYALHDSPHHSNIPLSPKKRYSRQTQQQSCSTPLNQSQEQDDLLDILSGDTKSADTTPNLNTQENCASFACKLTKYKANLSNANSSSNDLSKPSPPIKTVSEIVAELESVEVSLPEKPKEKAIQKDFTPMNNELLMNGSFALISDWRKFKIPKITENSSNRASIEGRALSSDLQKKTEASMTSDVEKQNDLLLETLPTEKSSQDNEMQDLENSNSLDEKSAQTKRGRGRPRKHSVVLVTLPVRKRVNLGRKKKLRPLDHYEHQELSGESTKGHVDDSSFLVAEAEHDLEDPVSETNELKEVSEKECEKVDDKILCLDQSPTCLCPATVKPTNAEQSGVSPCQSSPLQSPELKRARLSNVSPMETNVVGKPDTTVDVCTTPNVTIDETVMEATPNNTSQLSNNSNVSMNGGGIVTKRISLGSTDYRFEQMPNNQIKLVVTRRGRKRKTAELNNATPTAAPITTEPMRTGDVKP